MLSVLAGMMIAIGGTVYLTYGGIVGALLFAVGLLTILAFRLELFTGKAGHLGRELNPISPLKLADIWFGNFFGTMIVAIGLQMTGKGEALFAAARSIVETRLANSPVENLILGVFCGLLMYIAVEGYNQTKNSLFVLMPVATFIISGYNHCVADMFYLALGATSWNDYLVLIPTTIGNVIGCNILNLLQYHRDRSQV